MKKDTLILIAAAAAGLFFIAKVAKGMGSSPAPISTGAARATAAPDGVNLFASALANTQPLQDAYNTSGYYTAEVYNNLGMMGVTK